MKPQLRLIGTQENPGRNFRRSGGAIGTRENRFPQSCLLLFQFVEQAARPHKLRTEDTQSKKDGKQSGPGREYHHQAERENRKAENDSDNPLGSAYCGYRHCPAPVLDPPREEKGVARLKYRSTRDANVHAPCHGYNCP
jgi:hypothetical protein